MRLKKVTIQNFRHFTNLTIQNIPGTARLIVLAGPNGCGKSSLFDALHTWHRWTAKKNQFWDADYHVKAGTPFRDRWRDDVKPEFHSPLPEEIKKALYVRSAYRNDPEFQVNNFQGVGDPLNDINVQRMIDNDAAVAKNYQRLISQAIEDIFQKEDSVTVKQFKEQILGDVRKPFSGVFSELAIDNLGNPIEDGTFRFTKGASKGYSFKNLSGGEKAAFDLMLDLVIAKRAYDDTIFCIDEPEAHMNARLQAALLVELYDLVPDNCQLMLATHSIGMMRQARDIAREIPGSVVFLDFEGHDFDEPRVIQPTTPNRTFWNRAYAVALDDLAALVAPERVVICEGHPKTPPVGKNHSHDSRCYESIFETEFPETRFVSMGNDRDVSSDRHGLAEALRLLIGELKVVRLIDRDDRSSTEITDLEQTGVRVLSRRNLESYLFDDEVLRELAKWVNKEDKVDDLLTEKQSILAACGPANDLKHASGQIYLACKRFLGLYNGYGNNTKAFMRDTLAPRVKPGMAVYDELKHAIFGPQSP